jgi:isopenicillin N synthase-like dioxygenase
MNAIVDPPRLPAIDLSLFDVGDPWRDHVAAQIDWAASTFGLFQIVGHGVDSGLIDTLLELGGKYVTRPPRGPGELVDLPGFHDSVREYTTTMTGLGHKLMAGMARGLRLDDGFFVDRYTGNPRTSLRIRDYPVVLPGDRQAQEHDITERGLLTIVKLGDRQGQVRIESGWIDVPALPGALLCYIGPVLERLTHGHYSAAPHRLNVDEAGERPSLSFAFQPGPGAVLTPLVAMRPRVESAVSHSDYALAAR